MDDHTIIVRMLTVLRGMCLRLGAVYPAPAAPAEPVGPFRH